MSKLMPVIIFINKPSLYLQYKIHSYKNKKGEKCSSSVLTYKSKSKVSRRRNINDADTLNGKRTSSLLESTFDFQCSLLFLCSFVFKKWASTKRHSNASDPSSLARTRDLIQMTAQKPAIKRTHPAVYEHQIPGPSLE